MAVLCPSCGTTIHEDFGVVSCPACRAVVAIDLDGNATLNSEPVAEMVPADESIEPTVQYSMDPTEPVFDPQPISTDESFSAENPLPDQIEDPPLDLAPVEDLPTPDFPMAPAKGLQEDVGDFSSSVQNQGPLSYDVLIWGLDRYSMREELLEILAEPRLQIDVRSLPERIKNGKLRLKGLNPVKAHWIVRKLRATKLQVQWRQKIYEIDN